MPAGGFGGGGAQKGGASRSGGQKGGVKRSGGGQAPRNRENLDRTADKKAAQKQEDEANRVDKPKVQALKAKKEAKKEREEARSLEKAVNREMFENEKIKQKGRNADRRSKSDDF